MGGAAEREAGRLPGNVHAQGLEARLLEALRAGAERLLPAIQPNGRVELDGQWTTSNQACALTLAEVLKAGSGAGDIAGRINQSVAHFCALVDEKGEMPFFTATGDWGRYTPPWEFSGFLWLYLHHRDVLSKAVAEVLRAALVRMATSVAQELPGGRLHNLPGFSAAALWRAGGEFNEPSWRRVAKEYLERLAAACTPDGYWKEHTGPTPLYNLVYVHALGIHLWDGGAGPVGDPLRRAGAFHSRFVYPDGTLVSVIDGRVLYGHSGVNALGLPGLLQAASAGPYLQAVAGSRHPFAAASGNNLTLLPQVYRMLRAGVGVAVPGDVARVPLEGRANLLTRGPFTVALSALTGHAENRWGYDRLQHVEVHHPAGGVLVGGGLSRGPEMAFLSDGEHFLATEAELESGGAALRLTYPWGAATIDVSDDAAPTVEIDAAGEGALRLILPVMKGWFDAREDAPKDEVTVLKGRDVSLRLEPAATLVWPAKPWYPYHPEGVAPEHIWRYGLKWTGRGRVKVRLTFEGVDG
jgi:hypothetical protein